MVAGLGWPRLPSEAQRRPARKPDRACQRDNFNQGYCRNQKIESIVIGVGEESEKKIILWTNARREHLLEIDPSLFKACWEQVKRGKPGSQQHRQSGPKERAPDTRVP